MTKERTVVRLAYSNRAALGVVYPSHRSTSVLDPSSYSYMNVIGSLDLVPGEVAEILGPMKRKQRNHD